MQILSPTERQQIEWGLRLKRGARELGRRLGRHHSVIIRELRRNGWPGRVYRAHPAQARAERLSHRTNVRKLVADEELKRYVTGKLKVGWSPEQIAGRLQHRPPPALAGRRLCHETIYQYIYARVEPWEHLYGYLRRARRRRQRRYARQPQKTLIPERISIRERPTIINERERIGDWETDSLSFRKQRTGLSVQYERQAMVARLHKLVDKSATATEEALRDSIESLPGELWQSLTWDNGLEGVCHTKLRDDYDLATYFCDPYASWQKGGVENLNGLIRQYLPKSTNLATITEETIHRLQESLNNRPRKKLSYQTPNEVLSRAVRDLGGALNPRT